MRTKDQSIVIQQALRILGSGPVRGYRDASYMLYGLVSVCNWLSNGSADSELIWDVSRELRVEHA